MNESSHSKPFDFVLVLFLCALRELLYLIFNHAGQMLMIYKNVSATPLLPSYTPLSLGNTKLYRSDAIAPLTHDSIKKVKREVRHLSYQSDEQLNVVIKPRCGRFRVSVPFKRAGCWIFGTDGK